MIRRKPDIKWSKNLREVESLLRLQEQLLEAAARMVAPGGTLVYSTCTLEPRENQERMIAFLKKNPTFPSGLHPGGDTARTGARKSFDRGRVGADPASSF